MSAAKPSLQSSAYQINIQSVQLTEAASQQTLVGSKVTGFLTVMVKKFVSECLCAGALVM